jgi:N-acetylglucosamine-6-phosphate deacetylase
MSTLHGHILTPGGFVAGRLEVADEGPSRGTILSITGEPITTERVRESTLPILVPGFIDLHVHGAAGRDIMEGGDSAAHIVEMHGRHGTTSLLATTMTAPTSDLDVAFAGLRSFSTDPRPHSDPHSAPRSRRAGARVLGVHLEGPYINPAQLGAQPSFARPLDLAELKRLHAVVPIRLVTLAPEVPGHMEAIAALCAEGYRVQLGHSVATYEEGVLALDRGAQGFTHLFNAMSAMHHRKPGLVGAALAHGRYAEIIPDLLHVHPGAIRVALRAIPRLYCVTDSTAAAGMPDGEYKLGRHTVTKCMGGVRLADGTLAGSTLTMDQAFRNLVNELGLDLRDASNRVSTFAADYIGCPDRGRLQAGAWADVVALDRDLNVVDVLVEGASILRPANAIANKDKNKKRDGAS